MIDELQRIEIINIFEEKIYKHIISDLIILDTIQPSTSISACSVPTAMLILSSLDFIGFLLRPIGILSDSEKNIMYALKYNGYFKEQYNDEVIKTLVTTYRHGMMHSFFPLQKSGKIYGIHKSENKFLIESIEIENNYISSLNVNVLSTDFKRFVDELFQEIKSTIDPTIISNMYKSFKQIYPNLTTTTQTTVSPGMISNKLDSTS